MPRQGKLGRKNGHWYSEAGGTPKYYGKVGVVAYKDALRAFREHLAVAKREGPLAKSSAKKTDDPNQSVGELVQGFLGWLGEHRSRRTVDERARHLGRFRDAFGAIRGTEIGPEHLEAFQAALLADGHAPEYVAKHATSVRALFRRAVRMGWLPAGFAPFSRVEPIRPQASPIQEVDLLSDEEVRSLFRWADADLSPVSLGRGRGWRRREPEEYRRGDANPWKGFEVMLRAFHSTGARTSELVAVRVGDLQLRTHQLILGRHKRSATMRQPQARQIVLPEAMFALLERKCNGRSKDAFVFTLPGTDRPWNRFTLSKRFQAVRERAGVRGSVTIYSFRHLWISEALMTGIDMLTVARLAGTSLKMIEQVYGHLRVKFLQDAQARLDSARSSRGL